MRLIDADEFDEILCEMRGDEKDISLQKVYEKVIDKFREQPAENEWIPCNGNPEPADGEYIVTYKGTTETYGGIIRGEEVTSVGNATYSSCGYWDYRSNWRVFNTRLINCKVIAYKPLPEPYKEGEDK